MAGFIAASSSVASPSDVASAPAVAQSSPVNTTLAPRPPQKKKIAGYGFFYDSEDEAEAIAKQPAPKPLPSTLQAMVSNTATTTPAQSATTSFPIATISRGHGTGIKKLVIERKNQEDLFGVQESKRATNKRASLSNTSFSSRDARLSRTSPYGKQASKEGKLREKYNSSDEEVTLGNKNKFTMRGALETPRRGGSPKKRTPQQRQQAATAPAPTTPAATPAPAARLKSLLHAAANFLASPIRRPAQLVREMDTEVIPAPQSEDDESLVSSESLEEEQENQWPGSYRKTPEPESPSKPAYINPGLAKDPYATLAPRPASFGERFLGLQQKRAMSYTVSNDGQKRYWGARIPRHLLRATENSESITAANGSKRSRHSYNLTGKTEEQKKQILEELERELEANRRDRRVSARHDLEKRRVILAQMGVDWAEVEEREKAEKGEETEEDFDVDITQPKNKGKEKEKEKSKSPEPVATSTEQTPPPSRPTSFLFGGGTYKASDVPEAPAVLATPTSPVSASTAPITASVAATVAASVVAPVAPAAPAAPTATVSAPAAPISPRRARSPPSAPSPSKVTKKKASPKRSPPLASSSLAPPATPTLSHATLPPPVIPWNENPAYNQPPPTNLASPQKAVAGLGFGDPAHKARTQAEKFKPHVSSGLRASTTAQSDSPPRAAPGININRMLHPPEPAAPEPAPAPEPVPKKKLAPLYPLKTKKYGPDGNQVVEEDIDQGYLNKFLEVLGRGKSGDEKVLAAVNKTWTPPPVEETRSLYQFFVKVIESANQPI
ncbi:hypothetical protein EV426DRAFT_705734 [Tirmania nivea]|nr:hypothetical protein EV426DRAFT_705734 [Tirmania nivea]